VAAISERRIGFRFDVRERATDRLICEASYRVACVDATTFVPQPFPGEIVALLAQAQS
jgi:acyl-CoA thioesterase FadM